MFEFQWDFSCLCPSQSLWKEVKSRNVVLMGCCSGCLICSIFYGFNSDCSQECFICKGWFQCRVNMLKAEGTKILANWQHKNISSWVSHMMPWWVVHLMAIKTTPYNASAYPSNYPSNNSACMPSWAHTEHILGTTAKSSLPSPFPYISRPSNWLLGRNKQAVSSLNTLRAPATWLETHNIAFFALHFAKTRVQMEHYRQTSFKKWEAGWLLARMFISFCFPAGIGPLNHNHRGTRGAHINKWTQHTVSHELECLKWFEVSGHVKRLKNGWEWWRNQTASKAVLMTHADSEVCPYVHWNFEHWCTSF